MKHFNLECCVDSLASAQNAIKGGATRLELCSNLIIGGTTPSTTLFKQIAKSTNIPINVLIRPRFGDFLYNESEFQIICEDVKTFADLGAHGIVFGCLLPDGRLDMSKLERIRALSAGLCFTLHRAIDVCLKPYEAVEEAVSLEIDTILSSGQKNNCLAGVDTLKKMHQLADGRIDIMAGGGVSPTVIKEIYKIVPLKSFHLSGKKDVESEMTYRNSEVNMGIGGINEYTNFVTDENTISSAFSALTML